MGGSLLQIVAKGVQDKYLTGNPNISFFKNVYQRHTNFGIETLQLSFDSKPELGKKTCITIPRNGDLLYKMFIKMQLPALQQAQPIVGGGNSTNVSWTSGIGNSIIKYVSIEIGGKEIDKHYGEWLDIWNELNLTDTQKNIYNKMVYNTDTGASIFSTSLSGSTITLYTPLIFWFNRNPGLALPLIALQYHEITIHVEFENLNSIIRNNNAANALGNINNPIDNNGNVVDFISCQLLVDYIYLDNDERKRFAQQSHEYLIEQVQFTGREQINANIASKTIKLNYNHPIKYLAWVIQDSNYLLTSSCDNIIDSNTLDGGNQKLRYDAIAKINNTNNTFEEGRIELNSLSKIHTIDSDYFRIIQPYQHFPGDSTNKYIYTYSFALNPSDDEPSGTCNFSRIDNARLILNFDNTNLSSNSNTRGNRAQYTGHISRNAFIKVFAVNYNVLRITQGMGGIVYAN